MALSFESGHVRWEIHAMPSQLIFCIGRVAMTKRNGHHKLDLRSSLTTRITSTPPSLCPSRTWLPSPTSAQAQWKTGAWSPTERWRSCTRRGSRREATRNTWLSLWLTSLPTRCKQIVLQRKAKTNHSGLETWSPWSGGQTCGSTKGNHNFARIQPEKKLPPGLHRTRNTLGRTMWARKRQFSTDLCLNLSSRPSAMTHSHLPTRFLSQSTIPTRSVRSLTPSLIWRWVSKLDKILIGNFREVQWSAWWPTSWGWALSTGGSPTTCMPTRWATPTRTTSGLSSLRLDRSFLNKSPFVCIRIVFLDLAVWLLSFVTNYISHLYQFQLVISSPTLLAFNFGRKMEHWRVKRWRKWWTPGRFRWAIQSSTSTGVDGLDDWIFIDHRMHWCWSLDRWAIQWSNGVNFHPSGNSFYHWILIAGATTAQNQPLQDKKGEKGFLVKLIPNAK